MGDCGPSIENTAGLGFVEGEGETVMMGACAPKFGVGPT